MYHFKTVIKNGRPVANAAYRTWLSRPGTKASLACVASPKTLAHQSNRGYAAQVTAEPFLNGSSSNYVEEMYNAWLEDHNSVHKVSHCFRKINSLIILNHLDQITVIENEMCI